MKVEFHNETKTDIKEIKKITKRIFNDIKETKNMQVIFVTSKRIKEINSIYRNKSVETDVLSFINDLDDESLGDIFISLEKASSQALEYEHSFEREVGFLLVHGYLHLKGYDHNTKEEEDEMTNEQEIILKNAGLERVKK